jgi:hypothetical protein
MGNLILILSLENANDCQIFERTPARADGTLKSSTMKSTGSRPIPGFGSKRSTRSTKFWLACLNIRRVISRSHPWVFREIQIWDAVQTLRQVTQQHLSAHLLSFCFQLPRRQPDLLVLSSFISSKFSAHGSKNGAAQDKTGSFRAIQQWSTNHFMIWSHFQPK